MTRPDPAELCLLVQQHRDAVAAADKAADAICAVAGLPLGTPITKPMLAVTALTGDPELTVQAAAKGAGLSRASLYRSRLFQNARPRIAASRKRPRD